MKHSFNHPFIRFKKALFREYGEKIIHSHLSNESAYTLIMKTVNPLITGDLLQISVMAKVYELTPTSLNYRNDWVGNTYYEFQVGQTGKTYLSIIYNQDTQLLIITWFNPENK